MEKIKYMFMAVLVALVSMTVTSCSDDDDDENVSNQKNPSSMIVGTYTGILREPGDNTDTGGAPCYVAFERLSNTTVRLTRFICEKHEIDMENINLNISESNGVYKLNSERSLAIEGMYINGVLTITFQTEGGTTWIFNGKKEK